MAGDVLHKWDGALCDECDGLCVGTDAVACSTRRGLGRVEIRVISRLSSEFKRPLRRLLVTRGIIFGAEAIKERVDPRNDLPSNIV